MLRILFFISLPGFEMAPLVVPDGECHAGVVIRFWRMKVLLSVVFRCEDQGPKKPGSRMYQTDLVWHLWQSSVGNATVLWHTPQYFPSNISTMEYFVAPFFTPTNISG